MFTTFRFDLLLHSAINGRRTQGDLYYLGVGRSATVTVVETLHGWKLLTNGLPESGVDREEIPDRFFKETAWLSLLPTAARPEQAELGLDLGLNQWTIEAKLDDLAALPEISLTANERNFITDIGNNKGCMDLKGANPNFDGPEPLPDRWGLSPEHKEVGARWGIVPERDLVCTM